MIIADPIEFNKFESNAKILLYNIYTNLTLTFNLLFNVCLPNLHCFKTKHTPAYRTLLFSWSGFQRVVRSWLIHDANANRKQCFQDKTNTKHQVSTCDVPSIHSWRGLCTGSRDVVSYTPFLYLEGISNR